MSPFKEPNLVLKFKDDNGKEVKVHADKEVEIFRRDGPHYQIVFIVDGKEEEYNLHDGTISRKKNNKGHALFFVKDNAVYVTDAGSRSGTFVHGRQLPRDVPEQLYHEDIVRVGAKLELKIELAENLRETGFETIIAAPVKIEENSLFTSAPNTSATKTPLAATKSTAQSLHPPEPPLPPPPSLTPASASVSAVPAQKSQSKAAGDITENTDKRKETLPEEISQTPAKDLKKESKTQPKLQPPAIVAVCLKCNARIKKGEAQYLHECGATFHNACAVRMAEANMVCMECGREVSVVILGTPASSAPPAQKAAVMKSDEKGVGIPESDIAENRCAACQQDLGERSRIVCGCGRRYHSSCFRDRYNSVCPFCNQKDEEEGVLCGICQKEIPKDLAERYKKICICGTPYHRSCANQNVYCINCSEKIATVEGEESASRKKQQDSGELKKKAARQCKICLGAIKPGIPVYVCRCGKMMHLRCVERLGECPSCGIPVKLE
ncbi:MAG: FHA domain-containing protein [Thermoplasmata archaeon]